MTLLDKELYSLPEHLSSTMGFSGVRVILNLKCYVNYLENIVFLLFFRPLCCLSSIDWLSLITPLVYLNISNYYFMLHIWFQQIADLFTLVLQEYHLCL